jgi:hypothetical protein
MIAHMSQQEIAQKIESSNGYAGSLLERYAQGQGKMDEVYEGAELRSLTRMVMDRLPDGPVLLISTSTQGAGLAAACAVMRPQPTRWRKLDLLLPSLEEDGSRVVLLEVVDPGDGWRDAAQRRFPGAEFVFASDDTPVALAA